MTLSAAKARLDASVGETDGYITPADHKASYDDLQDAWRTDDTVVSNAAAAAHAAADAAQETADEALAAAGSGGSLPAGGAAGETLLKDSAADGDASWQPTRRVFVQSTPPGAGAGQQVGDLFIMADVGGTSAGFLPAMVSSGSMRVVEAGASIQDAIDDGPGWVFLAPGTHNIAAPIEGAKDVMLTGAGAGTVLNATAAIPSVLHVGDEIVRFQAGQFQIKCNGDAAIGVDVDVNFAGSSVDSEPDSTCRFDLMWIYDAANIGFRTVGLKDVQNTYTSRVRVRRAANYGFWNEGADNSFLFCDATTQNSGGAGFYAGGANSHYVSCKAWYCRGYGWHTKSTRSMFTACGSQDTRGHGWYIEYGKSTYVGCIADSAAYGDVGGVANGADGFYVADATAILSGCMAFDRMQGYPAQQRYGFNLPSAMSGYIDAARPGLGSRVSALHGWNNLTALFNWR